MITNDVSITAAEDDDWSVYLSKYVMCIMDTLFENVIENATAAWPARQYDCLRKIMHLGEHSYDNDDDDDINIISRVWGV